MRVFRKAGPRAAAASLCTCAVLGGLWLSEVRVALGVSESLPWRVFLAARGGEVSCGAGAVGLFRLEVENPYWERGTVFAKRFVGCPGDFLRTEGREFFLNGERVGAASETDSKGEAVGSFEFFGPIPEGSWFVLGDGPRSYDSRYWGFVRRSWVVGRAWPLF